MVHDYTPGIRHWQFGTRLLCLERSSANVLVLDLALGSKPVVLQKRTWIETAGAGFAFNLAIIVQCAQEVRPLVALFDVVASTALRVGDRARRKMLARPSPASQFPSHDPLVRPSEAPASPVPTTVFRQKVYVRLFTEYWRRERARGGQGVHTGDSLERCHAGKSSTQLNRELSGFVGVTESSKAPCCR